MRYRKAYIFITGFTQSGKRESGIERAWAERLPLSSGTQSRVLTPFVWDYNWEELASFMSRHFTNDVEIFVCAYSWGAGHGFIQFAKEIQTHGMKIKSAVLCDPVFRSKWPWMRWRSLVNRGPLTPTITIPGNVKRVAWCRQFHDKPQGHDLVAEVPSRTEIGTPVILPDELGHTWADDSEVFLSMCKGVDQG